MIDPDMLLRNFRSALANGHYSMAVLSAASLDEQLSIGGELPEEWKRP